MGSGAFLVEVVRQLGAKLVDIWTREGQLAAVTEKYENPHLHAQRLVAQQCVYGVDKNAAAVELAKLSLWLVTLSADLPFTFVDHALRHGDSLVGLDLEQIASFHWKPTEQVPLLRQVLEDALDEALEHRAELLELAKDDSPRSQEERRRLLDHADQAQDRVRTIADVCIGAFFAEATDKARNTERARRMDLVERWLSGDGSVEPELRGLAVEIRERLSPFHWMLEFPEVFYEERPEYMVDTDQGLTKTYNALKDPDCTDERILALRELHEEMDRAVLRAYPRLPSEGADSNDTSSPAATATNGEVIGWSDIPVPPFCIANDEDKAALQAFEDEVIDRLFVLNELRAKEEARQANGAGKHKKKVAARRRAPLARARPFTQATPNLEEQSRVARYFRNGPVPKIAHPQPSTLLAQGPSPIARVGAGGCHHSANGPTQFH